MAKVTTKKVQAQIEALAEKKKRLERQDFMLAEQADGRDGLLRMATLVRRMGHCASALGKQGYLNLAADVRDAQARLEIQLWNGEVMRQRSIDEAP